jgi:hypothetical protein
MLWGYRVPFLSAFPIVFTALLLRWQMPESDEFLASRRAAQEPAPAGAFSDSAGDALAAPHPKAAAPGAGRAAPRGAAARIPLARLLRTQWLGLLLDTLFVAWLTSVIYVVYAWIPSQLRSRKIMVPLTSLGMVRAAAPGQARRAAPQGEGQPHGRQPTETKRRAAARRPAGFSQLQDAHHICWCRRPFPFPLPFPAPLLAVPHVSRLRVRGNYRRRLGRATHALARRVRRRRATAERVCARDARRHGQRRHRGHLDHAQPGTRVLRLPAGCARGVLCVRVPGRHALNR